MVLGDTACWRGNQAIRQILDGLYFSRGHDCPDAARFKFSTLIVTTEPLRAGWFPEIRQGSIPWPIEYIPRAFALA